MTASEFSQFDDFEPPSDSQPSYWQSFARFRRLALKELREILRDRRTIVTLLLMPLLLYPLISIAGRQFLLAGMVDSQQIAYQIGVESQEDAELLQAVLDLAALGDDEDAAAAPDRSPAEAGGKDSESRQHRLELYLVDIPQALSSYSIHVGIRFDDQGRRPRFDVDEDLSLQAKLVVLDGSVLGGQAASLLREKLDQANEVFLSARLERLGVTQPAVPLELITEVIENPAGSSSLSLITVIPLILILMTITGAVYPAIDLTAGERERGTLEILVAAPVPRLQLLLAKYTAVVTVACLTAAMNLLMMAITIATSGLAPALLGDKGLQLSLVVQLFILLMLFAAFFSALLLALASFARSFKEAQAYLLPLMLASLAPGMLGIMPDLKLTPWLSVTPMVNIVLLARALLEHQVEPFTATLVVLSTALYALAAIAMASRLFGAEAVLYSEQQPWSQLFASGGKRTDAPSTATALMCLAVMIPGHILLVNFISLLADLPHVQRYLLASLASALLFAVVPLIGARASGLSIASAFTLRRPPVLALIGALVLGLSLWTVAHELVVSQQYLGFWTVTEAHREQVQTLIAAWRTLPIALLIGVFALVPAVVEELFFRGFLLPSLLSALGRWKAIVLSALIFGAFHLIAAGAITWERFLPSTFLGIVLGWVAVRTGSVLPGMLLHACHNGLAVTIARYADRLQQYGIGQAEHSHLPPSWLLAGVAASLIGAALVARADRTVPQPEQGTEPVPSA